MPLAVAGGAHAGGVSRSVTVAVPAARATASGIPPTVVTGQVKVSARGNIRASGYAIHPPRELTGGEYATMGLLAQLVATVAVTDFDASGLEAAVVALLTFVALMQGTRHLPPFN